MSKVSRLFHMSVTTMTKHNLILSLVILLAFIFRWAGITWAFPYHPHPDEWNMAAAITRLNITEHLDPHFYAYGQLPLYLAFFTAKLYHSLPWINKTTIDLNEAITFLRWYSLLASMGVLILTYKITGLILPKNKFYPILAAFLTAFTPGLIQIAHFGTTESLLSFFFLALVYLSFLIIKTNGPTYWIAAGIVAGLANGTKASALIFSLPVLLTFLIVIVKGSLPKVRRWYLRLITLKNGLIFLLVSVVFTIISCPYLVLNPKDSFGTINYETKVATGKSLVFYTRQFFDTQPVLFQMEKIFPYVLGWPLYLVGLAGITLIFINLMVDLVKGKTKQSFFYQLVVLVSFLAYFFSQAFLFTKWTRFLAPIFAFFPIFIAILFASIQKEINKKSFRLLLAIFCFLSIIPGIYFSTIYFRPDIRFTASKWIFQNIPDKSVLLYDTGNVVDIPLRTPDINPQLPLPDYRTFSFDFYHLDEDPKLFPQLIDYLDEADYIIIPSRRIFANHTRFPEKYPLTNRYYQLLFSGQLGFTLIRTFCPLPQLTSDKINCFPTDENAEETWSVFDHPVIRIYQKTSRLSKEQYQSLFKRSI